ncbi:MAG TPA: phosphoribosyltransferase family protein [Myxococcales bacterium]|nr:phosphoribosyltransferase family protein [Myxococcales bacterium]
MFRDRKDAGRQLARALEAYGREAPVVLGLPRGGVVVANEVAQALGAPLDVVVVRKVGAPGHEEVGMGAVAEGGVTVLNNDLIARMAVRDEELWERVVHQREELEARVRLLRRGRAPIDLHGRTVILVDDGIATGGTMLAALRAVRERGGRRIILAVPIGSGQALEDLAPQVDELVCLRVPSALSTIGAWYEDFSQTSDREVLELLHEESGEQEWLQWTSPPEDDPPLAERELTIDAGGVPLPAHVAIPPAPRGLVLFAYGSGSSRYSPRNQQVARILHRHGLATLLFDLLTEREERIDDVTGGLRFDIPLLARRLIAATDWVQRSGPLRGAPLLYFGTRTGAAAALIAAAERPWRVKAVVSCGGRPDLARDWLLRVSVPVLLLVGGADQAVLDLNQEVKGLLPTGSVLSIVPGATHLFEEPGAPDRVGEAAARWFIQHLAPPHQQAHAALAHAAPAHPPAS